MIVPSLTLMENFDILGPYYLFSDSHIIVALSDSSSLIPPSLLSRETKPNNQRKELNSCKFSPSWLILDLLS